MKRKIFIYVGGLTSCEKGAVGTHTKGILKGFLNTQLFSEKYIIGSNLVCFQTFEELQKIDLSALQPPASGFINKILFYKKYCNAIRVELDKIIEKNKEAEFFIYHRFALNLSHKIILAIRKLKATKTTIVLEYNDITNDQLKFLAQQKSWGTIGSFLRCNFITEKIVHFQEKTAFEKSDLNVAVTDKIKDYILSLSPKSNAVVVPNATDIDLIHSDVDITSSRKKLNIPLDKYVIAHVGTLTSWDGLIELINGLNASKHKNNILFYIIGNGVMKEKIISLVNSLQLTDNVIFKDAMPFDEAIEYVKACNLVPLLKTIVSYQLSPIKFYEALGMGKPILSTDIEYINEIKNTKYGKVVSFPLSIEDISNAIDHLFENADYFIDKQSEIKNFTLNHHTWNQRVETILKVTKI